ncbi:MAG: hypothetical protein WCP85_25545, partial [Mariniphaga sp.]
MKIKFLSLLMFLFVMGNNISAKDHANYSKDYGHTLNLGLGIGGYSGYYGYVGHSLPVFSINYEFGVANNFTLAPFATFYSYHQDYYRETVIPLGVK